MKRLIKKMIFIIIAVELFFAIGYLMYNFTNTETTLLKMLFDLDGESNLPAWFSSEQLFCVGLASGTTCLFLIQKNKIRTWFFILVPLLFIFLSFDEACGFHEWVGRQSDQLIGGREGTTFHYTGIWMFVLGIPLIIGVCSWAFLMREYIMLYKQQFKLMAIGFVVFFMGAVGIEMIFNFIELKHNLIVILVDGEEFCEMFGVTLQLWAWCNIIAEHFHDDFKNIEYSNESLSE